MGKKQKQDIPVVTGQISRFDRLPFDKTARKRFFLIATLLILVFVAVALMVATVLTITKNSSQKTTQNSDQDTMIAPNTAAPDSYDTMTPDEVAARFSHNTHMDIRAIEANPITDKTFPNFYSAYQAAQALYWRDNNSKSLQAYIVAEKMAPKNVSYKFYLDYANNVDSSTSAAKHKELLIKARAALGQDSSVTQQQKTDELAAINSRITRLEKGIE